MTSVQLERLRNAIRDDERATAARQFGAKVGGKQRLIEQTLSLHGEWKLWQRIRDCGTDRRRCGSPHCVHCHRRFVKGQARLMNRLFERYATEADQRENIRHVSVLFDAYGFDLESRPHPVFPLQRTLAGIKYARDEVQALKRHFPNIKILGALEIDVLDAVARGLQKNPKTLEALLSAGLARDHYRSPLWCLVPPPGMEEWDEHLLVLHMHLVVDLSGTDSRAFRKWCHKRWGNTRPKNPVPRGVHIAPLRFDRAIETSIKMLARYPLKTPFHYHVPKDRLGRDVAPRRALEPAILAAMVVGRSQLGIRHLRVVGRL